MKHALLAADLVILVSIAGCRGDPLPTASSPLESTAPPLAAAPDPDPASDRMAWWRDARFGMFIHWGLYAIPAGRWGESRDHAEWIMTTAQIPVEQYEQLLPQFDPVKFDPHEWARMAQDAGMKYVVITSKHHDGFALYDSKTSDYDVMATPFRRDILRELGDAVRARGLEMCFYHSIMDWHHPDYLPRRDWEKRSADGADFGRFRKYLFSQVTELLTGYGKIGVMWFDGEWESTWTNEYGKELYALCRELQPDVIVNNRVSTGRAGMQGMTKGAEFPGDFGTPEQEIPAQGLPGVDWETCMTMNDHWGFNAADESWKQTDLLLLNLCDIASKGGNFLLNVGPRADGTFPPEAVQRLAEIGRWMKVNGEAIHGTSASPLEAPRWGRCTMKLNTKTRVVLGSLYLHVFDWPEDGIVTLEGFGNHIRSAHLLADPTREVKIASSDGRVTLDIGTSKPDPIAGVVKVQFTGAPLVYSAPKFTTSLRSFLDTTSVEITASPAFAQVRYTLDGTEPSADSPIAKGPVEIASTCTIKARSFHEGRPMSATTSFTVVKVVPRKALATAPTKPGLIRERFSGDFQRMPDFSKLEPSGSDTVDGVRLPEGAREERLAYVFSGALRVAKDDVYAFALLSDDGSRLWIDGKLLVDNDGLHGPVERTESDALAAGWHAIRVEWFNRTGGAELALTVQGGAGEPRTVSAADWSH